MYVFTCCKNPKKCDFYVILSCFNVFWNCVGKVEGGRGSEPVGLALTKADQVLVTMDGDDDCSVSMYDFDDGRLIRRIDQRQLMLTTTHSTRSDDEQTRTDAAAAAADNPDRKFVSCSAVFVHLFV